jgi:Kef-type K+ transport system membrane component KefB
MMFLFDVPAPSSGALLAGAGIVFVIALAAVAYIAFRIFRKTMKMAFRMAMLAAVLIFVLGSGVGLWWFGTSKPTPRPIPQRTK